MTHHQVVDPLFPECPVRNILSRIGNRWTLLVLLTLGGGSEPMRFSKLKTLIPDISEKMLTQSLRLLEADGLVVREVYAEIPPRVEYALTERGRSLLPHLNELVNWALNNLSGIVKDRERYEAKSKR